MDFPITDESQIINAEIISAACEEIKAAAERFSTCSELILEACDECDAKAMSIDGATMQGTISDVSSKILEYQKGITNCADAIAAQASSLAAQQRAAYQSYLNYLAQQQAGGE